MIKSTTKSDLGLIGKSSISVALGAVMSMTLISQAKAQSVEAMVGGEFWKNDETKGHAVFLVHGQTQVGATNVSVELNTDTLTLRVEKPVDQWTYGFQTRGELMFAGLLTDYYVGAKNVPERTFSASYVELQADAKRGVGDHWFNTSAGLQRWFFREVDATGANFVLPAEAYVFKQRLGWTYWKLANDPSWSEAHRRGRRRISGLAVGVEAGVDHRSQVQNWGVPSDPRNHPNRSVLTLRQWAAAGVEWTPGWRLQVREWVGLGDGEDDLTRARVGGMNPYVVVMPGLPWASFLASRYAVGEVSQSMKVGKDGEIGVTANAGVVEDGDRVGDFDQFSALVGASTFIDWRSGDWQINAAFGVSPDVGSLSMKLSLSTYVDVGFSF